MANATLHTDLTPFVLLGMAVVVGILAFVALRWSVATIGILLAAWIASAALRENVDLAIVVSGVRFSALDVLAAVLAAVGTIRIVARRALNLPRLLVFALFALLAIHILRGIASYGMQTSANEARQWFYFAAAMLYGASLPAGSGRRAWTLLAAAALLLAAIVIPYFVIEGVPRAGDVFLRDGQLIRATPITAEGTLLIMQSAILVLALRWPTRRSAPYAALAAISTVVLLQQRAVWIAGAAVLALSLFWWLRSRPPRTGPSPALIYTGAALCVITIALLTIPTYKSPQVTNTTVVVQTADTGTLSWRINGWRQLVSAYHSPSVLAVGRPSGHTFERVSNGAITDVSPHNEAIDAYIRFGLGGVLVLIWLGWAIWSRRSRVGPETGITEQAVVLLLLSQVVFGLAWSLDLVQGLILGVLVSGTAAMARTPPQDAAEIERTKEQTGDRAPSQTNAVRA
jgi:O-Antigen ligase